MPGESDPNKDGESTKTGISWASRFTSLSGLFKLPTIPEVLRSRRDLGVITVGPVLHSTSVDSLPPISPLNRSCCCRCLDLLNLSNGRDDAVARL